jgi:mannose-P-dolichol utilization defect protein 1
VSASLWSFLGPIVPLSLILSLSPKGASAGNMPLLKTNFLLAGTAAGLLALMSEDLVPAGLLKTLMAAAIPLSVASKIPQIVANAKARSTGQLSAFLVLASFAGCAARVYTTSQETGDQFMLVAFGLQTFLNGVLGLQMLMYGGKPARMEAPIPSVVVANDSGRTPSGKGPVVSTTPQRVASPAPRSASKTWVRKVD